MFLKKSLAILMVLTTTSLLMLSGCASTKDFDNDKDSNEKFKEDQNVGQEENDKFKD